MTINKDEFFREVTIRICSSLDINIALGRMFEYLQAFLPLKQLNLFIPDESIPASRLFAFASDDGTNGIEWVTPIPKEHLEWIQEVRREPYLVTASHPNKYIRAMAQHAKLKGISILIMPLWVEDEHIGALTFDARGEDRYTPDHLALIETVAKPVAIALANALDYKAILKRQNTLIDDNRFLNNELYSSKTGEGIIGVNSGLRNVMEMVQQVAQQNTTVLLVGETGTGKEVIASAIHFASPRKDGPFIKLNCGAIPENLIDSELFGHEKGAFTGAVAEKRGRFERASGGTLFLDEIGELPPQSQVRLLRVLQSKLINRVGGEKTILVNVRVIAATNRDLKQMIAEGRFREDLWFRLNVFPITLPPLRQRQEDIPALIRHFVTLKSKEMGNSLPPPIAPGAFERLVNYGWPGNIRELGNLVERELIRYHGGYLRFDSLLPDDNNKAYETTPTPEGAIDCPRNLDEVISCHISKTMKMTKGRIQGPGGAAELLGINCSTLRARMRKLGIQYGHNGHKDRSL